MSRLWLILGCLLIAQSACVATREGPVIALPNAYYLQPDPQGQTELVGRDGHLVVAAPIAAYAVSGQIVAGALGKSEHGSRSYANDLPFHGDADTRYFVLDTGSGRVERDLDEAAWQRKLSELGVPHPEIYSPLPWQ